jgi:succinate-acetate transporter protein
VGSVALGLVLVGYVSAAGVGASLPLVVAATGLGLLVAAIWAAALGQSAVAGVFGIFAGFWLSYAVLVLGLTHNWFAIAAGDALHTQGLFVISWLVLIGTLQQSAGTLKVGGVVVFVFAAVGVYLFFSSAAQATGGKPLPLGNPIIR